MIHTIDRIGPRPGIGPAEGPDPSPAPRSRPGSGSEGARAFADELLAAGRDHSVNLSSHALRRLGQRRIDLQDGQLDRLRQAMDSLAACGARQSLVMLDQVAFVVDIPSSTVVTAVAPEENKEAVFTRIDSVAIA